MNGYQIIVIVALWSHADTKFQRNERIMESYCQKMF